MHWIIKSCINSEFLSIILKIINPRNNHHNSIFVNLAKEAVFNEPEIPEPSKIPRLVRRRTTKLISFYFVSEAPKFKNLFFVFVSELFLSTLLKSSDFNGFNHISWQIRWFTSQMRYNNLLFRNFIRFPDFPPDFSGFS